MDDFAETVAAWVRESLDRLGTQEAQAKALRADQGLVSRWRRGLKEPSPRSLWLIARKTGGSLAELGQRLDGLPEEG